MADPEWGRSRNAPLGDGAEESGRREQLPAHLRTALGEQASGSINAAGQQLTQKNLQIQPTIKVRPGFTVNVLVSKDIGMTQFVAPR